MAQAAKQQTIDDWAANNIAGSFADADEAGKRLRSAAEHCHLIGGATVCPMPEGYEVQIIVVPINKDRCYDIKGQPNAKGIGKSTLMTLGAAAGVEWTVSRRIDDGKDPRYCHWHVEGRYPLIDGTYRMIEGDRDIDLREGADQIAGKTPNEIAALRQNLMRSAITKAKLRALREGFGVDQGMPTAELDKPFVFAKAVFTGRSTDPRIRRMFASLIAQKQLLAAQALYGGAPALTAGAHPIAALPAGFDIREPIETVDYDDDGEVIDMPPTPAPAPTPAPPPPAPAATRQAPPKRDSSPRQSDEPVCRFGNQKGVPLSQLSDDDLEWYVGALQKSVDDPTKAKFRAYNERDLRDAHNEQERRSDPAIGYNDPGPVGDGYDSRKGPDDF